MPSRTASFLLAGLSIESARSPPLNCTLSERHGDSQIRTLKECTSLRVKIARDVHERMERYRALCGALELADLVGRALVYVTDKEADVRAQEKEGAAISAKGAQRWSVKWVSPADKTGGAP